LKEAQENVSAILQQQIEVSASVDDIVRKFEIVFEASEAFIEFQISKGAHLKQIRSFLMDLVDGLSEGAEDGYLGGDEGRVGDDDILFDVFEVRGNPKLTQKWPRYYT
jgi:hypothetical protein